MRVSILGAGAIAYGTAAFLANAGHDPMLWSPSGKRTAQLASGQPLVAGGAITGSILPRIASSCEEAVAGADVVMLTLPGNGHKAVLDIVGAHLRDGQPLIISAHLSFGALYLSKLLAARGICSPIIAWGTTLTTGRQLSLVEVKVGTIRKQIDIATVPSADLDEGLRLCIALFGERFVARDGLLAIALSNLNPEIHLAIALMNLTRLEHGEEWSQAGNITPAVGRFIEALDSERLAIADSFGVKVRTVREHFALTYGVASADVASINQDRYRKGLGVSGPKSLDTRYVLEDVPFGLVPTVFLGQLVGKAATLHQAGIEIFTAAYDRDFESDNDLLKELSLAQLHPAELQRIMQSGFID
jgi:opine dehydrogenase